MDKVALKKKLDNYWYYYKIHTFVAIFVIIVLAILIQQCASRVNPDLTVVVATQKATLTSDQQTSLHNYLQKFTRDVNKDGKKSIECDFLNLTDTSGQGAEQVKLAADMSSSNDIIYIMDDATATTYFKSQEKTALLKITDVLPDEKLSDPYQLPIENTKLSSQSYATSLSGLSICVRSYNKANKKASYVANINNQLEFLKEITAK